MKKSIILLAVLLATTTAQAQTNQCVKEREQIADCERLLDKTDYIISVQADTIVNLRSQRDSLEKQLDYTIAELAKEKAWYNDVTYIGPITFVLGVTLGAYIMRDASR